MWLFHSGKQDKHLEAYRVLGDRQMPVPISRPGKNSLDFHLAYYLGYISALNKDAKLVVVAIDGGYEPMIEHARDTLGFEVHRSYLKSVAPSRPKAKAAKKPAPKPAKKAKTVAAKKASAKVGPSLPATKKAAKSLPVEAKPATSKASSTSPVRSSKRTPTAVYRDVLRDLREHPQNRPRTREKLERFVATKVGPGAAPDLASKVVDHLFAMGRVKLQDERLEYAIVQV